MECKYDVFISYSRKDYVIDGKVIPNNPIVEIQQLFDANKISYWFDKDGIYSGDEFISVITEAIISSKMLLFISSKNSNASQWTTGEILLAKKRKKAILPVRIDDSDYNSKFELVLLAHDFINYYESKEEALSNIFNSVKKNNQDFAKLQARGEIQALANDFRMLTSQQDAIVRSILEKNLLMGITTKRCPICEKLASLESLYCERCGWTFPKLYAIGGCDVPQGDQQQLVLARANWHNLTDTTELQKKRNKLEEENRQLRASLEKISIECQALTTRLSQRDSDYSSLREVKDDMNNQIIKLKKEKDELSDIISQKAKEIESLKQRITELSSTRNISQTRSYFAAKPFATKEEIYGFLLDFYTPKRSELELMSPTRSYINYYSLYRELQKKGIHIDQETLKKPNIVGGLVQLIWQETQNA